MKPDAREDRTLRRRTGRRGDHALRLFCERLEDRTLLATMLWSNSAGGSWDVASNWVNQTKPTDHHVPTSADDTDIDITGITVTFSSGASDSVDNVNSDATLNLSAGTLNVGGTIQFSGGQLNLQGATLAGGTIAPERAPADLER